MADPIKVTLELRGEKYFGEITDADGLLFMSTIFNQEENALMESGRIEEAASLYKRRSDKRLEELRSQGKSDEELLNEWGQHLLNRVERDPDVRSLVASRIRERFPSIPSSLIRWSGKHNFAINLHIIELLQLLNGIIVPSMQLLNVTVQPAASSKTPESPEEESTPAPETVREAPKLKTIYRLPDGQLVPSFVQEAPEPPKEQPPEVTPVVPEVTQPSVAELKEEIATLKAMIGQREERIEQKSATLEAAIVQQRK